MTPIKNNHEHFNNKVVEIKERAPIARDPNIARAAEQLLSTHLNHQYAPNISQILSLRITDRNQTESDNGDLLAPLRRKGAIPEDLQIFNKEDEKIIKELIGKYALTDALTFLDLLGFEIDRLLGEVCNNDNKKVLAKIYIFHFYLYFKRENAGRFGTIPNLPQKCPKEGEAHYFSPEKLVKFLNKTLEDDCRFISVSINLSNQRTNNTKNRLKQKLYQQNYNQLYSLVNILEKIAKSGYAKNILLDHTLTDFSTNDSINRSDGNLRWINLKQYASYVLSLFAASKAQGSIGMIDLINHHLRNGINWCSSVQGIKDLKVGLGQICEQYQQLLNFHSSCSIDMEASLAGTLTHSDWQQKTFGQIQTQERHQDNFSEGLVANYLAFELAASFTQDFYCLISLVFKDCENVSLDDINSRLMISIILIKKGEKIKQKKLEILNMSSVEKLKTIIKSSDGYITLINSLIKLFEKNRQIAAVMNFQLLLNKSGEEELRKQKEKNATKRLQQQQIIPSTPMHSSNQLNNLNPSPPIEQLETEDSETFLNQVELNNSVTTPFTYAIATNFLLKENPSLFKESQGYLKAFIKGFPKIANNVQSLAESGAFIGAEDEARDAAYEAMLPVFAAVSFVQDLHFVFGQEPLVLSQDSLIHCLDQILSLIDLGPKQNASSLPTKEETAIIETHHEGVSTPQPSSNQSIAPQTIPEAPKSTPKPQQPPQIAPVSKIDSTIPNPGVHNVRVREIMDWLDRLGLTPIANKRKGGTGHIRYFAPDGVPVTEVPFHGGGESLKPKTNKNIQEQATQGVQAYQERQNKKSEDPDSKGDNSPKSTPQPSSKGKKGKK